MNTYILLIIVAAPIIFFLMREVNCWYLKINERIELQHEQNELLKQLLSKFEISSKDRDETNDGESSVNNPTVLEDMVQRLSKKENE